MELSERVENLGGMGGGYGYGSAYSGFGGCGLFLMAIFLVVLFSLFSRGWGGRGGYDGASVANMMGEFHPRENCADKLTWARYANYADPEVMRNHIEQIRDTGAIMRQQAVDTGATTCAIEVQTRDMMIEQERMGSSIIFNQNTIARQQEQQFYQAQLDAKNEALANQREQNLLLQSQLMQEKAAREADRRQSELLTAMNGQFCNLNNRVTGIEGTMLKSPQFYPFGGIQSVSLCGYTPCHNTNTNSGCGCA